MSSAIQNRLDTFLASTGVSSRRGAQKLINDGKVRVNNILVKAVVRLEKGAKVEVFQGKNWVPVKSNLPTINILALNKPVGFVTSTKRVQNEKIVMDLFDEKFDLKPVGRLDKNSSGILLFTNHGPTLQRLISPTTHLEKQYLVTIMIPKNISKTTLESRLNRLSRGVKIDGITTKKAKITLNGFGGKTKAFVDVVLKEGKNRQIRKMFGKFELPVVGIHRVRIGSLEISTLDLKPGKWKILTTAEISLLGLVGSQIPDKIGADQNEDSPEEK